MNHDELYYAFELENCRLKDDAYQFSGFCFDCHEAITGPAGDIGKIVIKTEEITLLLREPDGKVIESQSKFGLPRADVNDYFDSSFDYTQSGFRASVAADQINPQIEYKVYLRFGKYISFTDCYFRDGKVYYISKEDRFPQERGFLSEVQQRANLIAYDAKKSAAVYLYGEHLYLFAGKAFPFDQEGKTQIFLHYFTNQTDHLSVPLTDGGWYYDPKDFVFEEHEIASEYGRVACVELPKDYRILAINIGVYYPEQARNTWSVYGRPFWKLKAEE